MDINQVKERIEKKEAQIAKIEKRIAKWEANKSEAAYIKETAPYFSQDPKSIKTIEQLIAARNAYDPSGNAEAWVKWDYEGHVKNCENEIKRANQELEEAKTQLEKYKSQLGDKEEKANIKKIKVIEQFLDQWEANVIDYVEDNVQYVTDYYEANRETTAWRNEAYKVRRGEMSKEEYEERLNELKSIENDYKSMIHPLSMSCYSRTSSNNLDMKKLKEILDKDKETKYWSLVKKVEAITGEITNASALRIGAKGDLNGYIIGKNGKASVQTIGAGGYNIQIFHYRTIVHKIK